MRQVLLLLVLLAFSALGFAQGKGLRVEPGSVAKDVMVEVLESGYQDITPVTVTNNGPAPLRVVQRQRVIGKPTQWQYGTFNPRSRSGGFRMSQAKSETGRPYLLNVGQSATFYVVLEPRGVTGDGRVEVVFSDLNSGRELGTSVITSEISRQSTGSRPVSTPPARTATATTTEVRIYPNPTAERFYIETPPGVKIGRVEGINAIGRRVIDYDRPAGDEGYPVDKLPDGLYLISIYDDKGKKLKTLRLRRGRFGA